MTRKKKKNHQNEGDKTPGDPPTPQQPVETLQQDTAKLSVQPASTSQPAGQTSQEVSTSQTGGKTTQESSTTQSGGQKQKGKGWKNKQKGGQGEQHTRPQPQSVQQASSHPQDAGQPQFYPQVVGQQQLTQQAVHQPAQPPKQAWGQPNVQQQPPGVAPHQPPPAQQAWGKQKQQPQQFQQIQHPQPFQQIQHPQQQPQHPQQVVYHQQPQQPFQQIPGPPIQSQYHPQQAVYHQQPQQPFQQIPGPPIQSQQHPQQVYHQQTPKPIQQFHGQQIQSQPPAQQPQFPPSQQARGPQKQVPSQQQHKAQTTSISQQQRPQQQSTQSGPSTAGRESSVKEEYLKIPQRKNLPKVEKTGRKIILEVNYLALTLKKMVEIIHYDVAIEPDKPKNLMMVVITKFLEKNFPKRYPAYDGMKNLYSSGPLIDTSSFSASVELHEEGRSKPSVFEVTIQYAAKINLKELFNYLQHGTSKEPPQNAIHCLDVVLRHTKHLKFTKVGRSFFTRPIGEAVSLGGGLELWYGQFQSAVLGWKPFVNIDVAHKGFSKQQSVVDLIDELDNRALQGQPLPEHTLYSLKVHLKNLKVVYQVPGQSDTKRICRINDITMPPVSLKFKMEDGQLISVQDYFAKVKRYRIKYPNLPCLVIQSKDKKISYPAELCTVIGGQNVLRKMDGNQTTTLIKKAATPADIRKKKIQDIVQQSDYGKDPVINEFGLSVSGNFEKVEGRVLNPPTLTYLSNTIEPRNGQWNVMPFKGPKDLSKWAIVGIDHRNASALQNLQRILQSCGKDLSMKIANPIIENIQKRDLEKAMTKFAQEKYELVMVVVNPFGDDYAQVKKTAELKIGILTQCIKRNTVERMNPNTGKMLLQKINAKLNGLNHSLSPPSKPPCLSRPCMMVGADVTHPAPGQDRIPSIAAVAASYDPSAFKYNITTRLQQPRVEAIQDLTSMMVEHLEYFKKSTNGLLPEKIIMFRDGVSEGQFEQVLNEELTRIKAACQRFEKSYKPPITIIIVQKRHHTRFFPTDLRDMDKNKNAPAGTCVDSIITHPTELDFYLLSHASIQGTARPTRYHCIWDDSNMSENEIEYLTYYLCHLYGRCARTVSYPTPTYYAHWAANRASVHSSGTNFDLNNLERHQVAIKVKPEVIKNSPMFFI